MAVFKTTETRDDRGRLLTLERDTDLFNASKRCPVPKRIVVAELRRIAVAFITKERPDFEKRRETLHPFEGNKDRELYLFRWEDHAANTMGDDEATPYVQVGLYADGTLASYADTLTDEKPGASVPVPAIRFIVEITPEIDATESMEDVLNEALTHTLDLSDDVSGWTLKKA